MIDINGFNAEKEQLLKALDDPLGSGLNGKALAEAADSLLTAKTSRIKSDTKYEIWSLIAGLALLALEPVFIMAAHGNDKLLGYAFIAFGVVLGIFGLVTLGIGGIPIALIILLVLAIFIKLLMKPMIYVFPVIAIGLIIYYIKVQSDSKKQNKSDHANELDKALASFRDEDEAFRMGLIRRAGMICSEHRASMADYRSFIEQLYSRFAEKHQYEAVDSEFRDMKAVEDKRYRALADKIKAGGEAAPFRVSFGQCVDLARNTVPLNWWICPQGGGRYLALMATPETAGAYIEEADLDNRLKNDEFIGWLMPWEKRLFDQEKGFFLLSVAEAEQLRKNVLQCRGSDMLMKQIQVKTELEMEDYSENCWWWLRDDGDKDTKKAYVDGDGIIHPKGHRKAFSGFAIRPAGIIVL